jgi:hypothetical protein
VGQGEKEGAKEGKGGEEKVRFGDDQSKKNMNNPTWT